MAYRMGQAEIDAVARVIRSKQTFVYGRKEDGWLGETLKFEKEFARYIGVRHAIATANGTASLMTSLAALGVGHGDEVIVPGYTFIATALAVLAVGAIPVIAEIDDTMTLDPEDVRRKISRRTRCIIPVHMLGLICDLAPLLKLARAKGLSVVEDCAQATGGVYRGQKVGTWGAMGAFSHNHYKTMSCGEGGTIVTDSWKLFQRAMIYHDGANFLLDHRHLKYDIRFFAGMNFRMSEILGAVLRAQFKRLPGILRDMRGIKQRMHRALSGHPVCPAAPVHDLAGDCGKVVILRLPTPQLATRLADRLSAAGVPASSWFRGLFTDRHIYQTWDPILQKRGSHDLRRDPFRTTEAGRRIRYRKDMCPRTLDLLGRSLAVNISPDWSARRVEQVLRVIEKEAGKL